MKFEAGDHVYVGRGPAGAIKHHAIVVTGEDNDGWMEIVEFGVFDRDGNKKVIAGTGIDNALAGKNFGEVRKNRVKNKSSDGTWRPAKEEKKNGKNTATRSPEEVVRAAMFLLEQGKGLLPKYHITMANGECFAQWCQTGNFASAQADNLYGTVQKVQTVAKMLPVATVATGKKTSTASGAKGKTAQAAATAAVAGAVTAASKMVDQRTNQVHNEWVKTNQALDEAYQAYMLKGH